MIRTHWYSPCVVITPKMKYNAAYSIKEWYISLCFCWVEAGVKKHKLYSLFLGARYEGLKYTKLENDGGKMPFFSLKASLRQALYLKCFHTIALHILEFYLKQSIIWQTDNHTLFTILDASWSEYWYSVSNHTHLSSHIISFIFYFIPTHISSGPCDGNAMQDTGTAGTGCTGCSTAVFWPRSAPLHG